MTPWGWSPVGVLSMCRPPRGLAAAAGGLLGRLSYPEGRLPPCQWRQDGAHPPSALDDRAGRGVELVGDWKNPEISGFEKGGNIPGDAILTIMGKC